MRKGPLRQADVYRDGHHVDITRKPPAVHRPAGAGTAPARDSRPVDRNGVGAPVECRSGTTGPRTRCGASPVRRRTLDCGRLRPPPAGARLVAREDSRLWFAARSAPYTALAKARAVRAAAASPRALRRLAIARAAQYRRALVDSGTPARGRSVAARILAARSRSRQPGRSSEASQERVALLRSRPARPYGRGGSLRSRPPAQPPHA